MSECEAYSQAVHSVCRWAPGYNEGFAIHHQRGCAGLGRLVAPARGIALTEQIILHYRSLRFTMVFLEIPLVELHCNVSQKS